MRAAGTFVSPCINDWAPTSWYPHRQNLKHQWTPICDRNLLQWECTMWSEFLIRLIKVLEIFVYVAGAKQDVIIIRGSHDVIHVAAARCWSMETLLFSLSLQTRFTLLWLTWTGTRGIWLVLLLFWMKAERSPDGALDVCADKATHGRNYGKHIKGQSVLHSTIPCTVRRRRQKRS